MKYYKSIFCIFLILFLIHTPESSVVAKSYKSKKKQAKLTKKTKKALSKLLKRLPAPGQVNKGEKEKSFQVGISLWNTGKPDVEDGGHVGVMKDIQYAKLYPNLEHKYLLQKYFYTKHELINNIAPKIFGDWFTLSSADLNLITNSMQLDLGIQTTIRSIQYNPLTSQYEVSKHNFLINNIYPALVQNGIKTVLNVGFAHNEGVPTGSFDSNWHNAIRTKDPNPIAAILDMPDHNRYLSGVIIDPDLVDPRKVPYPIESFALSASSVIESIETRLAEVPDEILQYVATSGEHFAFTPYYFDFCAGQKITEENYWECIPEGDYSAPVLKFYREWLKRSYANNINELNNSWGINANFSTFEKVSPLAGHFNKKAVDDLKAFYDHMYSEAYFTEWLTAKKIKAATPICSISFFRLNPKYIGRSAYHSDMLCSGDWSDNNLERFDEISQYKYILKLASLTGKEIAFPFSGAPREPGKYCMLDGVSNGIPETFKPPCFDLVETKRNLHTMLTNGAKYINYGYFECLTNWSQNNGVPISQYIKDYVETLKPLLMFNQPLRPSLILHVGSNLLEDSITNHVIKEINDNDFHYALLNYEHTLDLPSARAEKGALVSIFSPEMDQGTFASLQKYAFETQTPLLLFITSDITPKLDLSSLAATIPQTGFSIYSDTQGLIRVYEYSNTTKFEQASQFIISEINNKTDQAYQTALKPFVAYTADPNATVDIGGIATDGLMYTVAVTNTNPTANTIYVQDSLSDSLSPLDMEDNQFEAGESKLFHFINSSPEVKKLLKKIKKVEKYVKRRIKKLKKKKFDVSRAENILTALEEHDAVKTKKLAGYLRILRMAFVKMQDQGNGNYEIKVVNLNRKALANANIQAEFPFQHNKKKNYITNTKGKALINTTPPNDEHWDFIEQRYSVAKGALVNLSIEHPVYKSLIKTTLSE